MWNFIVFCFIVAVIAVYLSRYLNNAKHQLHTITPYESETEKGYGLIHEQNTVFEDAGVDVNVHKELHQPEIPIDINIQRDMVVLKEGCNFFADIGIVCPLVVKGANYTIDNYNKQPLQFQEEVATILQNEWGSDKLAYTKDYIARHWMSADVMYCFVANGDLVGCVAIDRHNFYPFVSHLYVKDKYRGFGFAKQLLELCEEYGRKLKFTEIKLWCEKHLVKFYEKLSWTIETVDDKHVYVMSKRV